MRKHLYLIATFIAIAFFGAGIALLYDTIPVPGFITGFGKTDYFILLVFTAGFFALFFALFCAFREIKILSDRNRDLTSEVANLNSQNSFFLSRIPKMKSNIESLSTMREISRAININVEFEKILEEVLRIISQMTGASVLDIFLAESAESQQAPPLKAHFSSRGEHGYFYIYFDSDPESFQADNIELGDFRHYKRDSFSAVDTVLLHRGLYIGIGKSIHHTSSPDSEKQKLFLKEQVRSFEVNRENIAKAIELKNIIRLRSGRRLQLTAPLLAEQEVLGVIKMTMESVQAAGDLQSLENMLRESCKHISLAIKKAELYEKAVKDGMTNLYNKPHFLSQLNINIALSETSDKFFSLLFFDIDHFKQVNDTYGHLTGDIILIGVANVLRRNLREGDMAFRYGGEELAIILDNTTIRKATKVAERIRKKIKSKSFTGENGESVSVTVSVGVSQFYPDRMSNAENIIQRADQGLYKAKNTGRDKVVTMKKPRSSMK